MRKHSFLAISLSVLFMTLSCFKCKETMKETKQEQLLEVRPNNKTYNTLKGKTYLIEKSEPQKPIADMSFIPFEKIDEKNFIYGIYITFSDLNDFNEYNTAPCGNDCFYNTKGKYYLSSQDTLVFINDSTTYSEDCGMMLTKYYNQEKKIYHITINQDSIIYLKPIK